MRWVVLILVLVGWLVDGMMWRSVWKHEMMMMMMMGPDDYDLGV